MFEQVAGLKIRVDSEGVAKAESELRGLENQGTRTERSTDKLTKGFTGLNRSTMGASNAMSRMGPRAANVSYQLQDMVVQAQMGANGFTILGQQGSQLASAFGPGGVVFGAVVAVASALGGVLYTALSDAGDGIEELGEKIDGLVGKSTRLKKKYVEEMIGEQREAIDTLKKDLQTFDAMPEVRTSAKGPAKDRLLDEARNKRAEKRLAITEEIVNAEERLTRLQSKRRELNNQLIGVSTIDKKDDPLIQRADAVRRGEQIIFDIEEAARKKREKARRDEAQEIIQLERQVQQIRTSGLSPEDKERERHQKQMDVLEMYYKRRMNDLSGFHAAAEAEKQRHEQAMADLTEEGTKQQGQLLSAQAQTTLSATGQLFGNMASLYAEGGKDTFDEYKFFASAQAGIAAALAAVQALAVPPPGLGIALASTIGGLAAVQIAKIQSMEYQGRAIGGQVLAGQSYLVGERGPELLTMGGNSGHITPNHHLGDGMQPVQVTQVFQVSTGVVGTVRAEIMRMAPAIAEMSKRSIQQAIAQGGSMARSVGVRS